MRSQAKAAWYRLRFRVPKEWNDGRQVKLIFQGVDYRCKIWLNGNVINREGYISNLPRECCVEVPVYVDKAGLHPLHVGRLPPQLAALNQSNVTVQLLAAEAAVRDLSHLKAGKVAIVTGAGRGIGRAVARTLAARAMPIKRSAGRVKDWGGPKPWK